MDKQDQSILEALAVNVKTRIGRQGSFPTLSDEFSVIRTLHKRGGTGLINTQATFMAQKPRYVYLNPAFT